MTASLACTALDPEKARRLAAADETGSWARRFGYGSAQAARDADPVLYRLGRPGDLGLGRLLLGIGSAAEPSTTQLGCRETQYCNAGAVLSLVANIDFKPKVSIDIDTTGRTAEISLEGDVISTVGVGALAGGSCTFERELFFPSSPKPVATYCIYAVCITVLIQGSVKLAIEGELQATASAEYHTLYKVGGEASLELASQNLDQSANVAITADRVSDHWSLNAVGSMSASISVSVGPVVTVLVVPGTFATLHPYVMAQASLFGTMTFEKASASEAPEGVTVVSWPVSSEVCTDEAQKQSLAKRQFTQQRPGKETIRSDPVSGQGFTLAADLLDTDGQCFAAGLNAVVGIKATVLGPPPGLQDLTQVLGAVSSHLIESLTQFSRGSAVALGAVNCVGKWITGDDNFDMLDTAGLNAAVQALLAKIPTNTFDELPVSDTETCFDLYKASVGEGCLCSVGCSRREEDASCAGGTTSRACRTDSMSFCLLLVAWSCRSLLRRT